MDAGRSYSITELSAATGFDRRTIVYYIQSGLLPKVGRRGPHTRYPADCLTRLQFIRGVRRLQSDGQLLTATLAEIRRALAATDAAALQALLERQLPVDEVKALFIEPPQGAGVSPSPLAPTLAAPPAADLAVSTQANPSTMEPNQATRNPGVNTPLQPTAGVHGPAGERRSYGLADAGIRKRIQPDAAPTGAGVTQSTAHSTAHSTALAADDAGDLGQLLRDLELRPTMNAVRGAPGAPEQWTEIPITSRVYLSVRGLPAEDAPLAEAVARWLKRALRTRIAAG